MASKKIDPLWELLSTADLDGAVPAIIDTPEGRPRALSPTEFVSALLR
jgi:hypothetical protein